MLLIIGVILLILWLLGFLGGYAGGGLQVIQGRR